MRSFVCLAMVLALAAGAARADEQADLKRVIDKAIKATGGEENLGKYKALTMKFKGKFYGQGEGIDYTATADIQQPNKRRLKIEAAPNNMKVSLTKLTNGTKVWRGYNDDVKEIDDKEQIAEAKEDAYAESLTELLPLVKEKGFTFAALGEVKVNDKPAVGIRVSHKGRRDVNLFFDKDKALLVKSERTVKDEMTGGKEEMQETLYGDYKDVKGVMYPMKLVINRDGKKYVEAEVTELEPKDKIDDSVFDKP